MLSVRSDADRLCMCVSQVILSLVNNWKFPDGVPQVGSHSLQAAPAAVQSILCKFLLCMHYFRLRLVLG